MLMGFFAPPAMVGDFTVSIFDLKDETVNVDEGGKEEGITKSKKKEKERSEVNGIRGKAL